VSNIRLFDRRFDVVVATVEFTKLDCAFRIEKTLKPLPNTCDLTIYNLTREHQAQLEQLEEFKAGKISKTGKSSQTQATKGIPCRIEAGYADGMSLVWLGDLRTAQTAWDGPTAVTHLTSGDGEKAWKNARLHVSYGPNTSVETAMRAMVRALGVGEGNLSKFTSRLKIAGSALLPTGAVVSGSASRQISDFARSANLELSIQDGALQVLDRGKALSGESLLISRKTGMIGSPTVDNQGIVTVKTSMRPDVRCGGLMTIDADRIKGTYRIEKATWEGDTSSSEWSVEMLGHRY
jgi:hypothetical protein